VIFEHSGHNLFMDEPDRFFSELRSFTGSLAAVSEEELNTFRSSTEKWFSGLKALPAYALGAFGWGRSSSEALVKEYSRDWLDRMLPKMLLEHFAKVGFALYDMEQYGDALYVFENAENLGREQDQPAVIGVAKIWQGHMLDLLGERERARALYEEVAGMNLDRELSYSQYGMKYKISSWAKERLASPFQRVENQNPD
jgi:tetratricopeptide (TPR) repeat protein